MRRVGRRRDPEVVEKASGVLLAEGARLSEAIAHQAPATFVPKGVCGFKSHEEANRQERACLVRRMVAVALKRR